MGRPSLATCATRREIAICFPGGSCATTRCESGPDLVERGDDTHVQDFEGRMPCRMQGHAGAKSECRAPIFSQPWARAQACWVEPPPGGGRAVCGRLSGDIMTMEDLT